MRFGCCGSMISPEKDPIGIDIIEELKEIGYDYIELSLTHLAALPYSEFNRLKKRINASGIKCETCNNFFPPGMKLTGNVVDMEEIMDYVDKALCRASELGVEYVVFGSGPAKNVPGGFPMDKAWMQLITLLKLIDAVAKGYNITIVIEHLRKAECNIINKIEEALKLAEDVGGDNIKLLADFFHMSSEQEDADIILKAKDYIKHVHFARPNGRVFPKDINEDNYYSFIETLKRISYNGRVSIEAYSNDFHSDAAVSLKFLKKHFNY